MADSITSTSSLNAPSPTLQRLHSKARTWSVAWSWSTPSVRLGVGPLRQIAQSPCCADSIASYCSCTTPVRFLRPYRTRSRYSNSIWHGSHRFFHLPLAASIKSSGQSMHLRIRALLPFGRTLRKVIHEVLYSIASFLMDPPLDHRSMIITIWGFEKRRWPRPNGVSISLAMLPSPVQKVVWLGSLTANDSSRAA